MKINSPIKELPELVRGKINKYPEVWKALEDAHGDWVPIEVENKKELRRLRGSIEISSKGRNKRPPCECRVRGLTLYARLKKV